MRVTCIRCKGPALIRTSREMSETLRQLYCICRDPECGHTFVMDLSFSHTLSPSALDLPEQLRARMRNAGGRAQLGNLFVGL